MPDGSLAGSPAPANARRRACFGICESKLLFLLGLFSYFCLGASLMEESIRVLTRRVVCRELNDLPAHSIRDGTLLAGSSLCQTDEVKKAVSEAHMIKQLAQAGGGLLFSYYTIKQADRKGRFDTMSLGAILWVSSMFCVYGGLGNWSQAACWFFAATASIGRVLVEGSVFSMATDLSNNRNRSMVFTSVLCAAVLTQGTVLLLTTEFPGEHHELGLFLTGTTIIFAGSLICSIRLYLNQDTRHDQRENWREQNPPEVEVPVEEVAKSFKGAGVSLLFVAAAVVPLATASATSFEVYMPAAFGTQTDIPGHTMVRWMMVIFALFPPVMCTVFADAVFPRDPKSSPWRRDFGALSFALILFALGCALSTIPHNGSVMFGICLLTAGLATIFTHSAALLLTFVGPRIRSKFAARIWGFVYLCRSALTLVILPPMSIYSRNEPGTRMQFIPMVVVGAFILFAAYRARLLWPKVQQPEGAQAEDIELAVLSGDSPEAPPPAYRSGVPN